MPYNNNLKVNQLMCYYHLTWSSRYGSPSAVQLPQPIPGRVPAPVQHARADPRGSGQRPSCSAPARPAPPAALSAYLAQAPARAGLSEPAAAAALLKKPERAAPLSFYVRAREQPPPPGPAAAPGHLELPLSLSGAVLSASLLRSSVPPVLLCLRTPVRPGQPGGRAASGRGEGVRSGVEE